MKLKRGQKVTRVCTHNNTSNKNSYFDQLASCKRSQLTIFIIIAVIVVAIVVLFFVLRGRIAAPPAPPAPESINPESFLKSCMDDKVKETLKTLSYQGGYIENPLSIRFKFGSEPYYNISYLCYTSEEYLPCVVQQPSIINHLESEIKDEISEEMKLCFDDLVNSYTENTYSVDDTYTGFEADLIESSLKISINAKLTLTKTGDTIRKKDFKISFPTELYGIGKIVSDIIEKETKFGTIDTLIYNVLHPEYNTELYKTSSQTDIYTIEHKKSKEKFRFAVRGNVLPTD